jgi:tRNA-specific 2-thiouridylase
VPGPILDGEGNELGRHRGIGNYTIGQRKGLGISLGAPVFVSSIRAGDNTITVGARDELLVDGFTAGESSWTRGPLGDGSRVLVQHRAHGDTNAGTLTRVDEERWSVTLDASVEAIAPGQSAAFYSTEDPDELLGGGIIHETSRARALA